MKFHNVYGSAVTLTDNRTVATRSDTHFCNGIVFSDQPLKSGQKFSIEIDCASCWSGALRVGVTLHDPAKTGAQDLPKYAVPDLTKQDGYWVRPISEALVGDGAQLMFYVSPAGHLQFFVNNEHKGALLAGLPLDKSLWLLFDLYGNTRSAKCIQSEDAPKEIQARGLEAVRAFELACSSGMRPVYRTRLMFVGQDGVGKSSLIKSMIGQGVIKDEESSSGVSVSTSCCFTAGRHDNWTVIGSNQDTDDVTEMKERIVGTEGEDLEEEYHQALATNIVQELIYQRRQKASTAQKPKLSKDSRKASASKKWNGKPSSSSSATKFNDIPSEMFSQMPDRVIELVQKMLDEKAETKSETKSQDSTVSIVTTRPPDGSKVVLDFWDFSGREEYQATQSLLLSSRAVYIVVVNLQHDLEYTEDVSKTSSNELSPLESLDFWLRCIFAHASTNIKPNSDSPMFSPPILIVGTHRDSLDSDAVLCEKAVEEKFDQIRDFIAGKPYVQHLVTPFYAVDCENIDDKIKQLCSKIEEVSCCEAYMGERMPIHWIQFEHQLQTLTSQGFNYASYDQIHELASNLDIRVSNEIRTMLEFYHDLGVITYYDRGTECVDNLLRNIVILRPQWLIEMFNRVLTKSSQVTTDKWNLIKDKVTRLEDQGILEDPLLDMLWKDTMDQKLVLIGLLQKFDLICQRLPSVSEVQTGDSVNAKSYYVPSRLKRYTESKKLYTLGENDVMFYVDFHGFFPGSLFHRVLTKTVRWCQETGGQNPYCMYRHVARFYLDTEHDFVLEMSPLKYSRLKVTILRVSEAGSEDSNTKDKAPIKSPPSQQACAKVRNFLESCLCEIREMWMKRLSFTMCMCCPCDRVCEPHKKEGCQEESCLHFLNLDECLANKVVCCEHRRVKTANIRKCFPETPSLGFTGPVLPPISLTETCGNIEKHCPTLPNWVKGAAKLLNNGEESRDWQSLAKELGYKQNQMNRFNDDMNPALALLADWIITSGNTGLAVDMLCVYLEKLDREDVVEVIQKAQETDQDPPQIFLSYQWDSQDEVKVLRDKLERSGFMCWMDIGQLGGGDQLYNKIDEALRHCKCVIACVSPKYVVSHHCIKELALADLLHKPIIPVMIDKVAWPPPGGMSLIFSQLVYINLKGVGGHGGTGIHADKQDKYKEIIQRTSLYAVPDLTKCNISETDPREKHPYDTGTISSMDYSVHEIQSGQEEMSLSSWAVLPTQTRHEPAVESAPRQEASRRAPEVVQVTRCRVCTIL